MPDLVVKVPCSSKVLLFILGYNNWLHLYHVNFIRLNKKQILSATEWFQFTKRSEVEDIIKYKLDDTRMAWFLCAKYLCISKELTFLIWGWVEGDICPMRNNLNSGVHRRTLSRS